MTLHNSGTGYLLELENYFNEFYFLKILISLLQYCTYRYNFSFII